MTLGKHGDQNTRYLWTIDSRGVNIVKERGLNGATFKHTNLSNKAAIGGEVWFTGKRNVIINAGSGRFGAGNARVGASQLRAAAASWRQLGYDVTVIPFGKR